MVEERHRRGVVGGLVRGPGLVNQQRDRDGNKEDTIKPTPETGTTHKERSNTKSKQYRHNNNATTKNTTTTTKNKQTRATKEKRERKDDKAIGSFYWPSYFFYSLCFSFFLCFTFHPSKILGFVYSGESLLI
jgi:hypothetical protein